MLRIAICDDDKKLLTLFLHNGCSGYFNIRAWGKVSILRLSMDQAFCRYFDFYRNLFGRLYRCSAHGVF